MTNFTAAKLGPFSGGMRNSSGLGEAIDDKEVFMLENLEVDLDGTLVNRPAIQPLSVSGTSGQFRVLGKFLPDDGRIFLVVSIGGTTVRLIAAGTGVATGATATVSCVCVIQYSNKLWVIPAPGSPNSGGYFDAAGSPAFTVVATIPQGEAVVLYKERLFVGSGISSTSNTSRVRFCNIGDPLLWTGSDNFDVSPGDGEKLVDLIVVANDILIFKEHSTWRFTYSKLPSQAEITNIDRRIGVPASNCTVVYNSNTVYVLHDNAVYELFNSAYERISAPVALTQIPDLTLYAADTFGLTLYRDRLFVRYYSHMYVYALRTQRWSKWTTTRKFSKIVVISTASIGLDTAYMHSASTSDPNQIYFFRDDRIAGVGSAEAFNCTVTTKLYDFDLPQKFKAMSHGGCNIATSGTLTASISIPNATQNNTWDFEAANFIWDNPGNWDDQDQLIYIQNIAPGLGDYARKYIQCFKQKIRFRQAVFTITTPAIANATGADSSVKIFDLVVFMREAQKVTKELN